MYSNRHFNRLLKLPLLGLLLAADDSAYWPAYPRVTESRQLYVQLYMYL